MRRLVPPFLTVLLAVTGLSAQAVVDPGMTRAQVLEKLGPPAVERAADTLTILFYRNGLERRVGMSDLVVLSGDKVVDAIFRSPQRRYSGQSSSPAAIPAAVARRHGATAPPMQVPPPPVTPAKKP